MVRNKQWIYLTFFSCTTRIDKEEAAGDISLGILESRRPQHIRDTMATRAQKRFGGNLPQLQNLIKRDAVTYQTEVRM